MTTQHFRTIRLLFLLVVLATGNACILSITASPASTPEAAAPAATADPGEPETSAPTAEPTSTLTPEPTATVTATVTPEPVTMIAGQSLSCVTGPQWILYEWVTSIAEGETVVLLARSATEGDLYYYVRKSDGVECWAFGGSSTTSGDAAGLPTRETPPLPVITYSVANQTHLPVCDLFVRGQDETAWGADRLGAGTIVFGAAFNLSLTAGFYDVLIKNCVGETLYQKDNTAIGSDSASRNTVLANQVHFFLHNGSAHTWCRIRAVPHDGSPAFDLRTPAEGSVPPGTTIPLTLLTGIYDLQISRCGDLLLVGILDDFTVGPSKEGRTLP